MSGSPDPDAALSFGRGAQAYAGFRPGYPDEVVAWVLDAAQRPVLDVADVGAGTGALTRALVARAERVTAYEPDEKMLAQLGVEVPSARRELAFAERLPTADGSYDAVLSGQAWHWFDAPVAAREFARVLRPGGVVGVLWHVRDDRSGWMSALSDVLDGDEGMRDSATTERMASQMRLVLPGVERAEFPHTVTMTPDAVVGLISTFSYVLLSPDPGQVHDRVAELLATHPETRGRDSVEMPYVTVAYRWLPSTPDGRTPR